MTREQFDDWIRCNGAADWAMAPSRIPLTLCTRSGHPEVLADDPLFEDQDLWRLAFVTRLDPYHLMFLPCPSWKEVGR